MTSPPTAAYKIGDHDERPWGSYTVIDTGQTPSGEEFCTKEIVITPGGILSLQAHALRHEHWTVEHGVLTAILGDQRLKLTAGQSVTIPSGTLHSMANLTTHPCVIRERQNGICREDDITRYADANGRKTEALISPTAEASLTHYARIMNEISNTAPQPM